MRQKNSTADAEGNDPKPIKTSYQEKALVNQAKSEMKQIELAVKAFHLNTGKVPTDTSDLVRCPETMEPKDWRGPYLASDETPKDPWANPYKLIISNDQGILGRISLTSYGPNGIAGDDDDITTARNSPQP